MKKIINITAVLVFLLVIVSFSVNAVELKDVPKDHWAYKSVKRLIDKGYLSLYEDGTFKGNNKVSRYELAVIIARMLGDIQENEQQVTEEDADTLRKLSLEFRNELVEIAKKQENIFENIKSAEEKNVIQTNAIGENREKINSINKELSNVVDNILQLKKLSDQVEKLSSKVNEQSITIDNLKKQLNKNQKTISEINSNINNEVGSQEAINELKDQQSVTVTNVHSLKSRVNTLSDTVDTQKETIKELKNQNDKYKMYFIALAVVSLASF